MLIFQPPELLNLREGHDRVFQDADASAEGHADGVAFLKAVFQVTV